MLSKLYGWPVILTDNTNVFEAVAAPVTSLIQSAVPVALGLVAAIGAIYCIILGAKLAKAEEPQDREKAKSALKNAIIGFVLIFVLLVVLQIGFPALTAWYQSYGTTS